MRKFQLEKWERLQGSLDFSGRLIIVVWLVYQLIYSLSPFLSTLRYVTLHVGVWLAVRLWLLNQ